MLPFRTTQVFLGPWKQVAHLNLKCHKSLCQGGFHIQKYSWPPLRRTPFLFLEVGLVGLFLTPLYSQHGVESGVQDRVE